MSDTIRRMRFALQVLFLPVTVRIRSGPLQGGRWILASGRRYLRGYERENTSAFIDALHPGDVVFDVGAHVGYYTLIGSRIVHDSGQVVAFEPRPHNLRFLKRHIRMNGLANVRVVDAAVGARTGDAPFDVRHGSGTGRVSADGDLSVGIVALDDLVTTGDLPPPDFLKVDIEGGEVALLEGARDILARHRPGILLSTHGAEEYRQCARILTMAGYTLQVLDGQDGTEILALPERRP